MCLAKVTAIFEAPLGETRKGFKAFVKKFNELYFPYYTPNGFSNMNFCSNAFLVIKDQWLQSSEGEVNDGESLYPLGFHIFENEADARKWGEIFGPDNIEVLLVEATDIVAEGVQSNSAAFVARKMRVAKK